MVFTPSMNKLKYFISTVNGQIPNIVGNIEKDSFKTDLVLYLDNFLYKNSIYDSDDCNISLKEFCAIENSTKILLAFRNTPKILVSKRGNFKLTEDRFKKIIKIMNPDYFVDFVSLEIKNINGEEVKGVKFVDPKNIEEFNKVKDTENIILGTNFINEIIKNKKMIKFNNNEITEEEVYDCTCCGDLEKGYLAYLLTINEINGFIYLTIHNYNVLYKALK